MSKYKLYIRQYDITTNDYKVREEIVETNDIYHEIGKIYSTAFTEIKRIDYEKIDETKELKQEIERLNNIIKNQREDIEEYNDKLNEVVKERNKYLYIKKEARKYIEEWQKFPHTNGSTHKELKNLIDILDKGD